MKEGVGIEIKDLRGRLTKIVLTIIIEVRSLRREELKIWPRGGEKRVGH